MKKKCPKGKFPIIKEFEKIHVVKVSNQANGKYPFSNGITNRYIYNKYTINT